ncbi:MAG: T9SS type A sorting domain-containing protein [Chitinophagaceae bacterium]|nr:T9SS type A sorting domain-containing protein [Chitinophagaceae bacterium]
MVAGWSISTDGDIIGSEPNGSRDFWVVKLSSDIESGIASLTNSSISVYPNPVQNELIINLTIPVHKVRMQVCDLQGRTISIPNNFPNSSTAQNNTVKINTAELSNGFYTLRITDEKTGESKVTKFVKMQ